MNKLIWVTVIIIILFLLYSHVTRSPSEGKWYYIKGSNGKYLTSNTGDINKCTNPTHCDVLLTDVPITKWQFIRDGKKYRIVGSPSSYGGLEFGLVVNNSGAYQMWEKIRDLNEWQSGQATWDVKPNLISGYQISNNYDEKYHYLNNGSFPLNVSTPEYDYYKMDTSVRPKMPLFKSAKPMPNIPILSWNLISA